MRKKTKEEEKSYYNLDTKIKNKRPKKNKSKKRKEKYKR